VEPQKEYYLNEKLKAHPQGAGPRREDELEELKKKIDAAGMPKHPEKAVQELSGGNDAADVASRP